MRYAQVRPMSAPRLQAFVCGTAQRTRRSFNVGAMLSFRLGKGFRRVVKTFNLRPHHRSGQARVLCCGTVESDCQS